MYNYIINPKTKLIIKINSKQGKIILKKYILFLIAGAELNSAKNPWKKHISTNQLGGRYERKQFFQSLKKIDIDRKELESKLKQYQESQFYNDFAGIDEIVKNDIEIFKKVKWTRSINEILKNLEKIKKEEDIYLMKLFLEFLKITGKNIKANDIKIKKYLIFGPGIFTKIYYDLVKSKHKGKYIISGFNTSLIDFDGNFILATRLNHYESNVIPGNECKYIIKKQIKEFNKELVGKKVILKYIKYFYPNLDLWDDSNEGTVEKYFEKKLLLKQINNGKEFKFEIEESDIYSIGSKKIQLYEISPITKTYDGVEFVWNNWENIQRSSDLTYFYQLDEQLNLEKLKILIPYRLMGDLNLRNSIRLLKGGDQIDFLEDGSDYRIAKINKKYYLYSNDFSIFINVNFNKGIIQIEEIFELGQKRKFKGHNFVPINVEHSKNEEEDSIINIQYLDWFLGDHLSIKSTIKSKPEFNINFKNEGLFGDGSYDTGLKEDMAKYASFYGKTPGFSFNAPLIILSENVTEIQYMSTGHIKIGNPKEKYPYLVDSKVSKFRDYLNFYMDHTYNDKYKLHLGSAEYPFCNGYIYLMYFYKLVFNKKTKEFNFYFSDSYLPINESDEHKEKYKFSLIFPLGIVKRGDEIIVSAGEGDYYSILLSFTYSEINFRHNIKDFNIDNFEYYLLSYRN